MVRLLLGMSAAPHLGRPAGSCSSIGKSRISPTRGSWCEQAPALTSQVVSGTERGIDLDDVGHVGMVALKTGIELQLIIDGPGVMQLVVAAELTLTMKATSAVTMAA